MECAFNTPEIYLVWEHITIPESLDLCPNDFVPCKHIVVGKGWQANHFFILFFISCYWVDLLLTK